MVTVCMVRLGQIPPSRIFCLIQFAKRNLHFDAKKVCLLEDELKTQAAHANKSCMLWIWV